MIQIEHINGGKINNASEEGWYAVNTRIGVSLGPFTGFPQAIQAADEWDKEHGNL